MMNAWLSGLKAGFRRSVVPLVAAAALGTTAALVIPRIEEKERHLGLARIVDGDSIVVADREIRLVGIDAPELDQMCGAGRSAFACGEDARRHLVRLVDRSPVMCEGGSTGRYGRLLAQCTMRGTDLNAKMVEDGWAVSYRGQYKREEAAAKRAYRGIWSNGDDILRPADWRRVHRGDATGFDDGY